jgi:solute carrier family 30 (zinc transporter), member 2
LWCPHLPQTKQKLLLAVIFASIFMCVEVVGGIMSHSLAILTDAAHLLSDTAGFIVALLAAHWAAKKSGEHFSYGYHRVEVLGALASIMSVWLVTGILLAEAVKRLLSPSPVDGRAMFVLAVIGVVVNLMLMWILGAHHHHGHGHSHAPHDHSHGHDHRCGHGHAEEAEGCRKTSSSPSMPAIKEGMHGCCSGGSASLAAANGQEASGISSDEEHGHQHHGEHGHDHGPSHDHGGHGHSHHNLNLHGALIHAVGDLVQSVGVAIAGALIWWHQVGVASVCFSPPHFTRIGLLVS